MSYNYGACHAYVIPMDEAAKKLGCEMAWGLINDLGDPDNLVEYLHGRDEKYVSDRSVESRAILAVVAAIDKVIPPDSYKIFRPAGDMIEPGEVVEEGGYYLDVYDSALFTMNPTPLSVQLDAIGLTPMEDFWIVGG
jgi:hypothetical protein